MLSPLHAVTAQPPPSGLRALPRCLVWAGLVAFPTLLEESVELGNAASSRWSIPLLEAINLQAYDL